MTDPISFIPGQHYTTRDGREARVYATDGLRSTIHGAVKNPWGWEQRGWDVDGKFGPGKRNGDLVSPWIEKPVVNWAAMPAWAQWVARDESGNWFAHWSKEPEIHGEKIWWNGLSRNHYACQITAQYAPTYTGDWRNSKVQRPKA